MPTSAGAGPVHCQRQSRPDTTCSRCWQSTQNAEFKTRKSLAKGLILCKVNYCISLWGNTTAGIMQKIQVLDSPWDWEREVMETTSRNTMRSEAYVCCDARHHEVNDDMLKKSLFLPRWAFKDIYRSHVGGWPIKEKTTNMYLEELKAAGKNY